jgi:hypothetical protein
VTGDEVVVTSRRHSRRVPMYLCKAPSAAEACVPKRVFDLRKFTPWRMLKFLAHPSIGALPQLLFPPRLVPRVCPAWVSPHARARAAALGLPGVVRGAARSGLGQARFGVVVAPQLRGDKWWGT